MFIRMTRSTGRKILPLALLATLGACGSLERIADIGKAPTMTAIQNPRENPAYKPVSMPMPPVTAAARIFTAFGSWPASFGARRRRPATA